MSGGQVQPAALILLPVQPLGLARAFHFSSSAQHAARSRNVQHGHSEQAPLFPSSQSCDHDGTVNEHDRQPSSQAEILPKLYRILSSVEAPTCPFAPSLDALTVAAAAVSSHNPAAPESVASHLYIFSRCRPPSLIVDPGLRISNTMPLFACAPPHRGRRRLDSPPTVLSVTNYSRLA